MGQRIRLRRDTAANWLASNPILIDGELGLDTTNKRFRIGDGVTAYNALAIYQPIITSLGAIITPAINTANVQAHSLANAPANIDVYLIALVAANGYAAGEFVKSFVTQNFALSYDALNVSVRFAAALPSIIPKGGGAAVTINAASWALQWRANK